MGTGVGGQNVVDRGRALRRKKERGKVPSWGPGSGLWGGAGMEPEAARRGREKGPERGRELAAVQSTPSPRACPATGTRLSLLCSPAPTSREAADRWASRPRTVRISLVRKGDPRAPWTRQPRAPRPGLPSRAESSLPQRLRACTGQSPQRQGLESWAGTYGPRDPGEGHLCGPVSFHREEMQLEQERRWGPTTACSRVSLRAEDPDMVTRPLPVSRVSLQAGGPDMVTRPHPVQRAPSWPGWPTARCPGEAWLRQHRGPSRPRCAVVHAYQAGHPKPCGSRGHGAGPTASEGSAPSPWMKQWTCLGSNSPGNSGLPGEPLLDHRGDPAHRSALSPGGWYVVHAGNTTAERGSSGPGADPPRPLRLRWT